MLSPRDTPYRQRHPHTEGERIEKAYYSHGLGKQVGVSIIISNKVDFKPKLIRRDKEGHFILLK